MIAAPPVTIRVTHDFDRFAAKLGDLDKRQLPYAAARALTETARDVGRAITGALPEIFDRPTPFTLRAIGVTGARKDNLSATVFVKDAQAKYLGLEETGGVRLPARDAVVVPADIALNQYGNIPRGALQKLKGRGKAAVFVGTVKGVGGFWQRGPHGSIRLLAAFKPETHYRPRFGFRQRAMATAQARFVPALTKWIAQAIATAK